MLTNLEEPTLSSEDADISDFDEGSIWEAWQGNRQLLMEGLEDLTLSVAPENGAQRGGRPNLIDFFKDVLHLSEFQYNPAA